MALIRAGSYTVCTGSMVPEKFQPLNILQLIDSLHSGGAERMCVNIVNILFEQGYNVEVCSTRAGGPLGKLINKRVKYYVLNKRSSLDLVAFRKFLNILSTERINVIHAHSSSIFWAIAAKIFTKNLKVLWHDHLGARINDRNNNFFYKLISSKIDGIISVNNELAYWSRNNMKVPRERIVMINNFPMLNIIREKRDTEVFTIVCLANIRPQKDHATLIKAIGLLADLDLPKKLKVILAGSYAEDEYYYKLRTLVDHLGLGEIIEFRGQVEDAAALLGSADCGVLSSVSEGLPVSLLEYGMAGLPVVVTDVGQCAEVVGKGIYGKVVAPGNPRETAKALEWIIENRSQSEEMGVQFQNHVNTGYGPDKFMKEYSVLLNMIIEE